MICKAGWVKFIFKNGELVGKKVGKEIGLKFMGVRTYLNNLRCSTLHIYIETLRKSDDVCFLKKILLRQ